MTKCEHLMPIAKKMANGLAAKPGVHFVNREMVAGWIAQALDGFLRRGEIDLTPYKKKEE